MTDDTSISAPPPEDEDVQSPALEAVDDSGVEVPVANGKTLSEIAAKYPESFWNPGRVLSEEDSK